MDGYSAQIVLLNGSSSSGKSQLTRALQGILDEPFVRFDVDDFIAMFPERYQGGGGCAAQGIRQVSGEAGGPAIELGIFGRRFVSGFHMAVQAFARAGNQLIVSHLLVDSGWLLECVQLWADFGVLFVRVECDPAEIRIREQRRGDRVVGFAESHSRQIHAGADYDFVIDTTRMNSDSCAERLKERLLDRNPPAAFKRMRLSGQ